MRYEDNEESIGSSSSPVLLGSLIIGVLCLCVLMSPFLMGNGELKKDEKQFVQEQMQQIVAQRYAEEVSHILKRNVMENGGHAPPVMTTSVAAAPDQTIEAEYTEYKELNHARELRFHGKTEEAIRLMESYILEHPKVVVARVELANCYLKSKQPRKARLACIAGLMAKPSEHEKKALWQIIERCPKG